MDTKQWVINAQKGDRAACGKLVRQYERLAVMWAWKVVGDFHLAQDVVQDSFVTAFGKLDDLREPVAFASWLASIVRRKAVAAARKSRAQPLNSASHLDEFQIPDSRFAQPDWLHRHESIIRAIQSLPEQEQDVVVLFYLEENSAKQVAEMLDRPIGTVTKQLSRAIQRLQSLLIEVRDESK